MNYVNNIEEISDNINSNTIINADCIETMKHIKDKSIDCNIGVKI